MNETQVYIPYIFRSFQGFRVKDIKEFHEDKYMHLHLQRRKNKTALCARCGSVLGKKRGEYFVTARHLRAFGWQASVIVPVGKYDCSNCKKIRSELISFLCPTSPHITQELAWWINRMSEITSVLAVSRLESVDKMACYKVDHYILKRLVQGYEIPTVRRIAVDEVYARSKKQMKEDENRDDLFLTVIVDIDTRKVIWVSQSRRKEALDNFFELLGPDRCKEIEVVATDQHEGYGASVEQYCPNASLVWDRFHLVQKFNEALNEERKQELSNIDPEGEMGDLMNGKYRYLFLSKADHRSKIDKDHIDQVMKLNERMAKLEIIKEHFHRMYECKDILSAQIMLGQCYEWAMQSKAIYIVEWIWKVMNEKKFWNYWIYRVTTGISEGINRAIKGLKWQAYGYKNMEYFALKIMQKCGYLNSRYYLLATN